MELEFLVRAVIEDRGRFLVAHTVGAGNTYLPGGHLEIGEGMKQALARELEEELGIKVEVGEYLGAVEHAWDVAGEHTHEVNHFFEVKSRELDSEQSPPSQEDHVEFYWISPPDFEAHNLQPEPLRQLLLDWGAEPPNIWWASTLVLDG